MGHNDKCHTNIFSLLLNTFELLVHKDHVILGLRGIFYLFLVDFLSALHAPYNKLDWCGVYMNLMKGLMSSNEHASIIYVAHLSNMCHHFGDLSIVRCCVNFNLILSILYARLVEVDMVHVEEANMDVTITTFSCSYIQKSTSLHVPTFSIGNFPYSHISFSRSIKP